jgi:SusD family.
MREVIIHERRMEFAFECQRWFDLIRIGKNGEYAINYLKSIGKTNITKDRLLLPIPQTEMDSNNAMVQNPGY